MGSLHRLWRGIPQYWLALIVQTPSAGNVHITPWVRSSAELTPRANTAVAPPESPRLGTEVLCRKGFDCSVTTISQRRRCQLSDAIRRYQGPDRLSSTVRRRHRRDVDGLITLPRTKNPTQETGAMNGMTSVGTDPTTDLPPAFPKTWPAAAWTIVSRRSGNRSKTVK